MFYFTQRRLGATADPDALFEEYSAGGVTFHQPIRDDEDGLRGFEVIDAEWLCFVFWTAE